MLLLWREDPLTPGKLPFRWCKAPPAAAKRTPLYDDDDDYDADDDGDDAADEGDDG